MKYEFIVNHLQYHIDKLCDITESRVFSIIQSV